MTDSKSWEYFAACVLTSILIFTATAITFLVLGGIFKSIAEWCLGVMAFIFVSSLVLSAASKNVSPHATREESLRTQIINNGIATSRAYVTVQQNRQS